MLYFHDIGFSVQSIRSRAPGKFSRIRASNHVGGPVRLRFLAITVKNDIGNV